MKNLDFHETLRFPMVLAHFCPQDRPKIDLRSPQDGLKTSLKRITFLRRFYDRFLFVLGVVLGAFWGAKTTPRHLHGCGQIARPPLGAPRPPKMRPRAPKRPPRPPQMTLNDPQDDPK